MDDQKQQVIDRLQQANNILVTVSNNPSVDQLAACIGLTIALNKMKKHATAVFSGNVPSVIGFLQPEKTLEKNTDSLRDFIISLDKSKADKLRYKIEDKVVKIFITPYRTSINQKDLEFSEGDFNVDVVLALGVHNQNDLDQAITSHGRILHDAVVVSVNVKPGSEVGSINLLSSQSSSLSELVYDLLKLLDKQLIDNQIATALLTGIVAETERFRNSRTSPSTMSTSAELLAAGANQELVASKLESPPPAEIRNFGTPAQGSEPQKIKKVDDGTLEIQHDESRISTDIKDVPEENNAPQIHIDDDGLVHPMDNKPDSAQTGSFDSTSSVPSYPSTLPPLPPLPPPPPSTHVDGPHMVMQPPTFSSQLTANATPNGAPSDDEMTLPRVEEPGPMLDREPLQSQSVAPSLAPPRDNGDRDNTGNAPPPPMLPPVPPPPPPPLSPSPPAPLMPPPSPPPPPPQPPNMGVYSSLNSTPQGTLGEVEQDVNRTHIKSDGEVMPSADSKIPPAPSPFPPSQNEILTPAPLPTTPPSDVQGMDKLLNLPTSNTTEPPGLDLNDARKAVDQALSSDPNVPLEPIQSLNAQGLGAPLHDETQATAPPPPQNALPDLAHLLAPDPNAGQAPVTAFDSPDNLPSGAPRPEISSAPPAVPPPMLPPIAPL